MQNEQKQVQALKAHLALNVKDVETSLAFYRKLLGIERKIRRSKSTVESDA
jgi:extradiol dioxygenase family protein